MVVELGGSLPSVINMRRFFSSLIAGPSMRSFHCSLFAWTMAMEQDRSSRRRPGRCLSAALLLKPRRSRSSRICASPKKEEEWEGVGPKRTWGGGARCSRGDVFCEEIRALHLRKVENSRAGGLEPYAYTWERTRTAEKLQKQYLDLPDGVEANSEEDHMSVAGRIIASRTFGRLAFPTLRDGSATMQGDDCFLFRLLAFPCS